MSKILLEKVNYWKIYFIITICITNIWGELKGELNQNKGDYIIVFHKWFFSDHFMIVYCQIFQNIKITIDIIQMINLLTTWIKEIWKLDLFLKNYYDHVLIITQLKLFKAIWIQVFKITCYKFHRNTHLAVFNYKM